MLFFIVLDVRSCVLPILVLGDVSWVLDMATIARNPMVTAVNTCIEADLTGQVCTDSIGTRMYSGINAFSFYFLSLSCYHIRQRGVSYLHSVCLSVCLSVYLSVIL